MGPLQYHPKINNAHLADEKEFEKAEKSDVLWCVMREMGIDKNDKLLQ